MLLRRSNNSLEALINLIALISSFFTNHGASACGSHDIETVYGGYENLHGVYNTLFAMDQQSFDIAVAG